MIIGLVGIRPGPCALLCCRPSADAAVKLRPLHDLHDAGGEPLRGGPGRADLSQPACRAFTRLRACWRSASASSSSIRTSSAVIGSGKTEIYWQFAWRIPALQPGTAVITTQMPLDYETDLSMTAALNWMYASIGAATGIALCDGLRGETAGRRRAAWPGSQTRRCSSHFGRWNSRGTLHRRSLCTFRPMVACASWIRLAATRLHTPGTRNR